MNAALVELLRKQDFCAIDTLAKNDRRLLSRLTGLSYHPDAVIADAAVAAFGRAAAVIAETDPEYVRGHLRRLFWLLNDESGGIGWRAPEMIGEVLACCPGTFDEFISPLAYLLDMELEDAARFTPGILRALARIARARPQCVAFARPLLLPLAASPDPEISRLSSALLAIFRF